MKTRADDLLEIIRTHQKLGLNLAQRVFALDVIQISRKTPDNDQIENQKTKNDFFPNREIAKFHRLIERRYPRRPTMTNSKFLKKKRRKKWRRESESNRRIELFREKNNALMSRPLQAKAFSLNYANKPLLTQREARSIQAIFSCFSIRPVRKSLVPMSLNSSSHAFNAFLKS